MPCKLLRTWVLLVCGAFALPACAVAADWQYELEMDRGPGRDGRPRPPAVAKLWIPPQCPAVRGIVLGQMTRLEKPLLVDPVVRRAAQQEGLAVIFVEPSFDILFNFEERRAGEKLDGMLRDLAKRSDRPELPFVPLITVGHSTGGIFARNVAYWQPHRVLGVIHIKSGNLHHHVYGNDPSLAGVPLLAINGQYEEYGPEGGIRPEYGRQTQWVMIRQQMLARREKDPDHLMSLVVHPGGSHGSWDATLSELTALFIRKAVEHRLPDDPPAGRPVRCRRLTADDGWLTDAEIQAPRFAPAPYDEYEGPRDEAFWHFDEEMAASVYRYHRRIRQDEPPEGAIVLEVEAMQLENASVEGHGEASGGKLVHFDHPESKATGRVRLEPGQYEVAVYAYAQADDRDAAFFSLGEGKELRLHWSARRPIARNTVITRVTIDRAGHYPVTLRTAEPHVRLDRVVFSPVD